MKKIVGVLVVSLILFVIGVGHSFAGDGYIDDVTYSSGCVKVRFGSTEDDRGDKFLIRVRCFVPPKYTKRKMDWRQQRSFRNVSGSGNYVEFCGQRGRTAFTVVYVQLFHNGKLEDQKTWSGSGFKR